MSIESHIPESLVPTGSLVNYLLKKLKETGTDIALIDCTLGEMWNGNDVHESILRCSSGLMHEVGIKKGDVVCVYAANSYIHSIAFMSIIALGGIHTSCTPDNTLRELLNVIFDTGASYVICSPELINTVEQAIMECGKKIRLLVFANDDFTDSNRVKARSFNKLLHYKTKMDPVEANDEDPAALMMSSGSTGVPKHIVYSHKNLKNIAIQAHHEEIFIQIRGKDVFSGQIPLQSGVGCFALLHSICSNVPVAIQPGFNPVLFMKYVNLYKITSAFLAPTALIKLIDCPTPDGCDLSSLINIISGGSSMPKHVPNRLHKKLPATILRACYGLSETAFGTIVYKSDSKASSFYTNDPTVGKPFPGVRIKIIDRQTKKILPIGSLGEICISGNMVTAGYYNSPLTHEDVFIDGTFFRTGDAGYYDRNGNVFIISRLKDIIKVGPVTVSPVELELLLLSHEDVLEVAVVGIRDEEFTEVPKAFVVLKKDRKCEEKTLIEFIKNQVHPSKQLRGGVKFVEDLPKSCLGKVQKSKLKSL